MHHARADVLLVLGNPLIALVGARDVHVVLPDERSCRSDSHGWHAQVPGFHSHPRVGSVSSSFDDLRNSTSYMGAPGEQGSLKSRASTFYGGSVDRSEKRPLIVEHAAPQATNRWSAKTSPGQKVLFPRRDGAGIFHRNPPNQWGSPLLRIAAEVDLTES